MNPFSNITEQLLRQPRKVGKSTSNSKAGVMREALRDRNMTAQELALVACLPNTGLVNSLLRYDIDRGRVLLSDGVYCLDQSYDGIVDVKISQAKALLKRHGYRVEIIQ